MVDGECELPPPDRNTVGREVLNDLNVELSKTVEETRQVVHGAGRQVMEDDEAPFPCSDILQAAVDPFLRALPITGETVPQHSGIGMPLEICDGCWNEEPVR